MTDQLRTFFENYCETYDRFDPDGPAAFITRPLVIVRAGEVSVYNTPEEVRTFFAKLLEWFTGIRHGKGSISSFEVRSLGDSSAFVNVVWRSTRDDGAMYTGMANGLSRSESRHGLEDLMIVLRYEAPRETRCS